MDIEGDSTIVWVNMANERAEDYLYRHATRADELRQSYKLLAAALALSLERGVRGDALERDAADEALAQIARVLLPAMEFAGALRARVEPRV